MYDNVVTKVFPAPDISIAQLDEFLDRLPYLSEKINEIHFNSNENNIYVSMVDAHDADFKSFLAGYQRLLENASSWRIVKEKVIKSNLQAFDKNQYPQTKKSRGFLNEAELNILQFLDAQFIKIAKKYSAMLRDYPTTINAENMKKNQYHYHFPQNIYSIFQIPHNHEVLQSVRENRENLDLHMQSSNQFMQPCICYHCYEEWENSRFSSQVITAKGKCFRHEIPWKTNRFRRNEFSMREIVFIGDKEHVLALRNNILEDVWSFFVELGFTGKVVTANDPFYYQEDFNKVTFQQISAAKYELQAIMNENKVAIASFNFCDTTLSKKYHIKELTSDEYLYSGCVAFGLDRWVEVFLAEYGEDENNWPDALQSTILEQY